MFAHGYDMRQKSHFLALLEKGTELIFYDRIVGRKMVNSSWLRRSHSNDHSHVTASNQVEAN